MPAIPRGFTTLGPVGVIDITKLILTGGKSPRWGGRPGGISQNFLYSRQL